MKEQEQRTKKNMVKKSEGFILILVLFTLYLVSDNHDYILEMDKFTKHVFGHVDSLERQNKVLYNTVDSLLEEEVDKDALLEKICTSIIEDNIDFTELAKGYDCLARLEAKKKDPSAIYRAIKNESYALEAFYDEKYSNNLLSFIIKGYEREVALDEDGVITLSELSNSRNKEIRNRALYRMSLINSIGRTSSLEDYNLNLELASDLRNEVQKAISFPKKKFIDVVISLNNNIKYIEYAKTTISSVLLNSDLDSEYRFHIIMDEEDPILEVNKTALMSLQSISPYQMEFKTLPKSMFSGRDGFSDLKTRVLFSRFLVEDLFPELDFIISLDVDVIVLRDLYDLQHRENLDKFVFAGVIEGQKIQDRPLCKFPYTYINAGILVQNLKLMRQIGSSNLILNKYKDMLTSMDSKCVNLLDQSVINLLYRNETQFISSRWNYIPALNYSTRCMPFIIHYAGIKPWVYSNISSEYLKLLNIKYQEFAKQFSRLCRSY